MIIPTSQDTYEIFTHRGPKGEMRKYLGEFITLAEAEVMDNSYKNLPYDEIEPENDSHNFTTLELANAFIAKRREELDKLDKIDTLMKQAWNISESESDK